jgi:hypothetical protein
MDQDKIIKLAIELLKSQNPSSIVWAQEAIELGQIDDHQDCENDSCSRCFAEEYIRMARTALEFMHFT